MRLLAVQLRQCDAGLLDDAAAVVAVAAELDHGDVPVPAGPRRRGRSWSDAIVMLTEATALGLADDPGHVPGYGPVPADIARELLASAGQWRRFPTDDHGRLTDVGSRRYRPSDRLRELITARDLTCTFDTCGRPSTESDLDHLVNFDGGSTTGANLRPPCRTHHRLKTHGTWRTALLPDGLADWVSPTGHHYRKHADPICPRDDPARHERATSPPGTTSGVERALVLALAA
jgi:hypothetical protein